MPTSLMADIPAAGRPVAWWSEMAQCYLPFAPPFGFFAARYRLRRGDDERQPATMDTWHAVKLSADGWGPFDFWQVAAAVMEPGAVVYAW